MFRSLVAIMTATAVLWHSVAGCCAHHGHDSNCQDHFGCTAHLVGGGAVNCDECCHHGGDCCEIAEHSAIADDNEKAHAEGGLPSQKEQPENCTGGSCVFPLPESSNTLAFIELSPVGLILWLPSRELLASELVSITRQLPFHSSPPPLGGLRAHLSLLVLTI